LALYLSGLIVGFIVLQTAIVAPALAKTLTPQMFGTAVRDLWPRFFIAITVLGAGLVGALAYTGSGSSTQFGLALFTAFSGLVCYVIIPATNRAADEKNTKRFHLLHRVSIGLTVLTLLANVVFPFA
jgi:MFS-type transporter involved in bile tolerance (Atg22 family)